jgi:hypothetical protein
VRITHPRRNYITQSIRYRKRLKAKQDAESEDLEIIVVQEDETEK